MAFTNLDNSGPVLDENAPVIKVCVVSMQKDEVLLLPSFISYYGALFGYAALHIIDNGSAEPTRKILQAAAALGCTIYHDHPSAEDFERKGEIIGSVVNALRSSYDVFITVDGDEFLGVKTENGRYSCQRDDIFAELSRFKPDTAYRMLQRLRNNPLDDRQFYDISSPNAKLVFGTGKVEGLCLGLHSCTTPTQVEETMMVLFEFHNKPYPHIQNSARAKLKLRVNLNDEGALRAYDGAGAHLPRYLLFSHAQYLDHLATQPWFETDAIHQAFVALGLPHHFGTQ